MPWSTQPQCGSAITFNPIAPRGQTSVDWFYGFKLHWVIDDPGEWVAVRVTAGNLDDRKGLRKMANYLKGKLFGDPGYISKILPEELWDKGIQLITPWRRKMKKVAWEDLDKILLRKRSLIKTVHDQLKNISPLEHTRHRSLIGFMVNVVCALIAYSWQPNKPLLNLRKSSGTDLVVVGEDNTAFVSSLAGDRIFSEGGLRRTQVT